MPLLRSSPSDYTAVVKSLAVAGAAVSNPQGSRPASKGSVPFVNVASVAAIIRASPRLVTMPTPKAIVIPKPTLPIDPNNYTVYQTTLLFSNNRVWNGMLRRDTSGNLYYRNSENYKFWKVAPDGTQTFIAGNGINNSTFIPGPSATAQFRNRIWNMVLDSLNNIYAVNDDTAGIIKIVPNGDTTLYAGTGNTGYTNGTISTATFTSPFAIAIDASDTMYVWESGRKTIRKITSSGEVSTITFSAAFTPFFYSLAVDSTGVIYALDIVLHRVYKITPTGTTTADVALLAGSTSGYTNGQGSTAQFNFAVESGLCVDTFGNVYVGDTNNGSVRKITPSGDVITIVGNGTNAGLHMESNTQLRYPRKLIIDSNGRLYIATEANIRRITPVS